jgi:hypothetical protein
MESYRRTALQAIQRSLLGNPKCRTGAVVKAVWYSKGECRNGPEALCPLYAQDADEGYWYGHVAPISEDGPFAAYIVRVPKFISASTDKGMIIAFFAQMAGGENVGLPLSGEKLKTYAEAPWFEVACQQLSDMVRRFDCDQHFDPKNGEPEIRISKMWEVETESKVSARDDGRVASYGNVVAFAPASADRAELRSSSESWLALT